MATRFYFPSSGEPFSNNISISETWNNYEDNVIRLPLLRNKSNTKTRFYSGVKSPSMPGDKTSWCVLQYVSDRIGDINLTGTVYCIIKPRNISKIYTGIYPKIVVKIVDNDNITRSEILLSIGDFRNFNIYSSPLLTNSFAGPLGAFIKNIAISNGDRIVVELGAYTKSGETINFSLGVGDNNSKDLELLSGFLEPLANPFIEFSTDLPEWYNETSSDTSTSSISTLSSSTSSDLSISSISTLTSSTSSDSSISSISTLTSSTSSDLSISSDSSFSSDSTLTSFTSSSSISSISASSDSSLSSESTSTSSPSSTSTSSDSSVSSPFESSSTSSDSSESSPFESSSSESVAGVQFIGFGSAMYTTDDTGETWVNASDESTLQRVCAVCAAPNTVYAIEPDNPLLGANEFYLFASTNNGETYSVETTLTNIAMDDWGLMVYDYDNDILIILATNFNPSATVGAHAWVVCDYSGVPSYTYYDFDDVTADSVISGNIISLYAACIRDGKLLITGKNVTTGKSVVLIGEYPYTTLESTSIDNQDVFAGQVCCAASFDAFAVVFSAPLVSPTNSQIITYVSSELDEWGIANTINNDNSTCRTLAYLRDRWMLIIGSTSSSSISVRKIGLLIPAISSTSMVWGIEFTGTRPTTTDSTTPMLLTLDDTIGDKGTIILSSLGDSSTRISASQVELTAPGFGNWTVETDFSWINREFITDSPKGIQSLKSPLDTAIAPVYITFPIGTYGWWTYRTDNLTDIKWSGYKISEDDGSPISSVLVSWPKNFPATLTLPDSSTLNMGGESDIEDYSVSLIDGSGDFILSYGGSSYYFKMTLATLEEMTLDYHYFTSIGYEDWVNNSFLEISYDSVDEAEEEVISKISFYAEGKFIHDEEGEEHIIRLAHPDFDPDIPDNDLCLTFAIRYDDIKLQWAVYGPDGFIDWVEEGVFGSFNFTYEDTEYLTGLLSVGNWKLILENPDGSGGISIDSAGFQIYYTHDDRGVYIPD